MSLRSGRTYLKVTVETTVEDEPPIIYWRRQDDDVDYDDGLTVTVLYSLSAT